MHIIDHLRAFAASDKHSADKGEAAKFVDGIEQNYYELFGKDTLGVSEQVKAGPATGKTKVKAEAKAADAS